MTFQTYPDHVAHLQRATEAVLAAHKYEAVVLCSGAPQSKNRFDDQSWPLSPTPAFASQVAVVRDALASSGRSPGFGPGEFPIAKRIYIGAVYEDSSGYPDCRPEFLSAFEQLANLATKAGVSVPWERLFEFLLPK